MNARTFDVIVVGGGPAGATAALRLAKAGRKVLLADREGRIKPCGGAIPTRAIRDYDIPPDIICARINAARIISPSGREVEMDIGDRGHVAMVDRETFDPWLRQRAQEAGAAYTSASFSGMIRDGDGLVTVTFEEKGGSESRFRARTVIGADGANSAVRRVIFGPNKRPKYVFAYHEIIEAPKEMTDGYTPNRCDVVYRGSISPDFYGWVFPHGKQASVGCGSAVKGHDMKAATRQLCADAGLAGARVIRREGAPLPLKPMRRWDDGRNVVLAGDAAGVVAPSSGEGIYYAMLSGELCADAAMQMLDTGKASALATARKRFMKEHGRVFFILGLLQFIWYRSDRLREQFVKMCADPDVQALTWESYLNKKLVRRDPAAHLRVLVKDIRQLLGLAPG
ncbi:MAG TPA: geranylgeranyl diphosphate reductase [Rhizobiaceae bacterium]|nr:geranylgeranyl diphosphate reductase [Rhizobiaceae bacterium]